MKKIFYLLLILSGLASCSKEIEEVESPYKYYVCVYGTSKATLQRMLIACIHRDLLPAGNNQVAADRISESLGIPKTTVSHFGDFTNKEAIGGKDCNCN